MVSNQRFSRLENPRLAMDVCGDMFLVRIVFENGVSRFRGTSSPQVRHSRPNRVDRRSSLKTLLNVFEKSSHGFYINWKTFR